MGDAGMLQIFVLTTGGSLDKTYSGEASDFVVAEPVARGAGTRRVGALARRRRPIESSGREPALSETHRSCATS